MGSASDTASSISDATGSVAESARQAPQAVVDRTQGSPLVMGAVAFGLGFVAAAVFPCICRWGIPVTPAMCNP